jgi:hypothetical protein
MPRNIRKTTVLLILLGAMFALALPGSAVASFWGRPYPYGYAWGPRYRFDYAVRHRRGYRVIRVESLACPHARRVLVCR